MPLYEYACEYCDTREVVHMGHDSPMKATWDNGGMYHEVLGDRFSQPIVSRLGDDTPLAQRPHMAVFKRVFSFAHPRDVIGDGYFDHSANTYVTSEQQLADHNARKSEEVTAKTGVEHRFVSRRIEDVTRPEPTDG